MIIQKEMNEIDKQIETKENEFTKLTKFMIIKKPIINE